MSHANTATVPPALRFAQVVLFGFILRNLNLIAFAAGLMMILFLDREALAAAYLALGFAWFVVWLVSGKHHGGRKPRRRVMLTETGTLGGTVTMLD